MLHPPLTSGRHTVELTIYWDAGTLRSSVPGQDHSHTLKDRSRTTAAFLLIYRFRLFSLHYEYKSYLPQLTECCTLAILKWFLLTCNPFVNTIIHTE